MLREVYVDLDFEGLRNAHAECEDQLTRLYNRLEPEKQTQLVAILNYLNSHEGDARFHMTLAQKRTLDIRNEGTPTEQAVRFIEDILSLEEYQAEETPLLSKRPLSLEEAATLNKKSRERQFKDFYSEIEYKKAIDQMGLNIIPPEEEELDAISFLRDSYRDKPTSIDCMIFPERIKKSARTFIEYSTGHETALVVGNFSNADRSDSSPGLLPYLSVVAAQLFSESQRFVEEKGDFDTYHENLFVYALRIVDYLRKEIGLSYGTMLDETKLPNLERFRSLFSRYFEDEIREIREKEEAGETTTRGKFLLGEAKPEDFHEVIRALDGMRDQIVKKIENTTGGLDSLIYRHDRHSSSWEPGENTVFSGLNYDLQGVRDSVTKIYWGVHQRIYYPGQKYVKRGIRLRNTYFENKIIEIGQGYGLNPESAVENARKVGWHRIIVHGSIAHDFSPGFEEEFLSWGVIAKRATRVKIERMLAGCKNGRQKYRMIRKILEDFDSSSGFTPEEYIGRFLHDRWDTFKYLLEEFDKERRSHQNSFAKLKYNFIDYVNDLKRLASNRLHISLDEGDVGNKLEEELLEFMTLPFIYATTLTEEEFREGMLHCGRLFTEEEIDEIKRQYRVAVHRFIGGQFRENIDAINPNSNPRDLSLPERVYVDLLRKTKKLSLKNAIEVYGGRKGVIGFFFDGLIDEWMRSSKFYRKSYNGEVKQIKIGGRNVKIISDSHALFLHGWLEHLSNLPTLFAIDYMQAAGIILDPQIGYDPDSPLKPLMLGFATGSGQPERKHLDTSTTALQKFEARIAATTEEAINLEQRLAQARDDFSMCTIQNGLGIKKPEFTAIEREYQQSQDKLIELGAELGNMIDSINLPPEQKDIVQRALVSGLTPSKVLPLAQQGKFKELQEIMEERRKKLLRGVAHYLG